MKKIFLLILLSQYWLFLSCTPSDDKKYSDLEKGNLNLSGKQLSLKYCQSCHLYPDPSVLDKDTWERSVLPLMGRLFGIYESHTNRNEIINGAINQALVEKLNIFPARQIISDDEWEKIRDYYISSAPDTLQSIEHKDISFTSLEGFEMIIPSYKTESLMMTLIKIDQEKSNIYIGESKKKFSSLTIVDENFNILDVIKLPSSPVDVHISDDELKLTLIGSLILTSSDNSFGELLQLTRIPGESKYSSFSRFLYELNRPLQTVVNDINGNGLEDLIINEFGYYTGSLTLFRNRGQQGSSYDKQIIKNEPGAIRTYIRDMNNDGHKDIITLFGQGDEGISIFYNEGQGEFTEERVLRFKPSYGSVYFELIDFNNDGSLDILYCNGDNGDYPPILKDYHGIRIFENDGSNNFEQVYFYPMHGAYKCSAADFKKDGNLDIIAISHFPDLQAKPRQDIVYLKNHGNYTFKPQLLPDDISPRRWVTFDIGDIDGDGYKDILLGASGVNQFSSGNFDQVTNTSNLLLLKNVGS